MQEIRYEILELMGQGTFGQVVQCRELSTNQYVAIKIIKRHNAFTAQGEKEINILKMLNQALNDDMNRYLQLRDHFVFREHICIVFELLSVSLHKVLRQSPQLSISDIKPIAFRLLETLDLLKSLHIVHTDLKPDNILLKSSDDLHDVKLIDYGSACIEHEMPLNYHIQTAFYRSPEVILRIPYDCSIDMWSFGCFVAEMFIGKPLFPSGNEAFLLYMMIATLKSLPPDSMLKKGIKSTAFFHLKGTQSDVTRLREKFTHDFQSLDERVMGCESEETNEDRICLLDFLKKILVYEPDKRYTPQQALNHPFITSSQPHSTSHIHTSLSTSPTTEESSEIKTPPIKILPSTKPLKSILKKKESMDLKGLVSPPQPQLENTLDSTIAFLYQPRPLIQPDPSLLQKNHSHPTLMMYPSYYPQYQPNQSSRYFSP
ncbi:hypothetical protein G6F46_005224 [Rhizopus delemar]|uniref:Protein kinase domain-containing protein n=3 Tax=Rhizopus TaxID=4842 RepID=I1BPH9_RHIO9|nr:hypothetical protein RO3G_02813 [Rhizopus delemar RA 99-880]KAG1460988.1 hypothetical protein G6F55_003833 [Rhizopus delemar]KAG1543083.1 hypothetical protein G6F51_006891 [Rhizopus arrhizus]KAG1497299.1 hypothetical protein G6F54_005860 [Rhizopus delemar]KAG1514361.1 hypothetical protein G6F53_003728 [Rhizopus delemar]|eukprot:EIE78109.1 hypothetical protein RO3G_02813 [Rhizopus delemar RA 99-880]